MSSGSAPAETCQTKQADLPCPNHYIHSYKFPELSVGSGSNEQSYFRAMIFFHKKPGLTDEFFHEHWKSVHADLTMQVEDAGIKLSRYVQFHQEEKDKKAIAPLLESGGMQLVTFDGAAEFHCKDAESFVKFMNNVYNAKHLVGCGTRFVDMTIPYQVMVGYDNLIYGRAIEDYGGKDGIREGDSRLSAAATQTAKTNTATAAELAGTDCEAKAAVTWATKPPAKLKAPVNTTEEVRVVNPLSTPWH